MDFLKHSKVAYFLYLMDEIMDYSHVDSKVSAEAPQDQKPYIIVNTLQKLSIQLERSLKDLVGRHLRNKLFRRFFCLRKCVPSHHIWKSSFGVFALSSNFFVKIPKNNILRKAKFCAGRDCQKQGKFHLRLFGKITRKKACCTFLFSKNCFSNLAFSTQLKSCGRTIF